MKHNFKRMDIWLRSKALAKEIYDKNRDFPPEEKFGLLLQIRKSAVSIPSNIAEGCGRSTDKETARFMDIAVGSSCELETQLYLGMDLNYFDQTDGKIMIDELVQIRKMIIGFKNKLEV